MYYSKVRRIINFSSKGSKGRSTHGNQRQEAEKSVVDEDHQLHTIKHMKCHVRCHSSSVYDVFAKNVHQRVRPENLKYHRQGVSEVLSNR